MNHKEAQLSLAAIETARHKARELRGYRATGSIISAWGLVWLAGFGTQHFSPAVAGFVWLAGWCGALCWTFTRPRRANDGRSFATWVVLIIFVAMLLAVIQTDQRTAAMVFALALAASYAVIGIWAGKRFLALAGIVLLTAVCGWWVWPEWLFLLLAIGGGSGLMLGGAWLSRP